MKNAIAISSSIVFVLLLLCSSDGVQSQDEPRPAVNASDICAALGNNMYEWKEELNGKKNYNDPLLSIGNSSDQDVVNRANDMNGLYPSQVSWTKRRYCCRYGPPAGPPDEGYLYCWNFRAYPIQADARCVQFAVAHGWSNASNSRGRCPEGCKRP